MPVLKVGALQESSFFSCSSLSASAAAAAWLGDGSLKLPSPPSSTQLQNVHRYEWSCLQQEVLAVVGGGAAGIFGAIRAKSLNPSLNVLVLEKSQLLAKVKISGGGRCNVTTGLFEDPLFLAGQYPRGHKELRGSFFRVHGPRDTVSWFAEKGVVLKTEEDGRMFPASDTSSTIIDCLLSEALRLGDYNLGDGMHELYLGQSEMVGSRPVDAGNTLGIKGLCRRYKWFTE